MTYSKFFLLVSFLYFSSTAYALNGFTLKPSLIPVADILSGGPPKDGIPAIDNPHFMKAKRALLEFSKNERAIIVEEGKVKKAYPISILNWHEIVNDVVGTKPIVVTYCPLCGTGIVFDARIKGLRHSFGVSGLLYQSDVLLYDRKTNSLWSQIMAQAVTGKNVGEKLKVFPSRHVLLHDYLQKNASTLVLSKKTGHQRDYSRDPYAGYEKSKLIFFPIKNTDQSFQQKAWSLFLQYKKHQQIVVLDVLKDSKNSIRVNLGKRNFEVHYDKKKKSFICPVKKGLSCMTGYWFALRTFYPKAKIFKVK